MANEQQKRSPTKRKAMQAVRDGVRRGHISKPSSCTKCGKTVRPKLLSGHHGNGYASRRNVTWLCPSCHSNSDSRMNHSPAHKRRTASHLQKYNRARAKR